MISIIKKILLLIGIILAIYFVVFLFRGEKNNLQTCNCLEVVGDEGNFICYTPTGELDTKGECVGPKIYK